MDKYKNFFYPDTVAIIGASRKPFKFGNLYLKNLLEFGFPREKMFPINPSGEVILGIQSYPSLDKTPEKIGLAYITVPAKYVVQELKNCIKNSIDSVIIVSSGFKELNEKGVELEEEIKRISASEPINVIGPNCFGTYCPQGNITLLPGELFPKEQGSVAIFAQSGGVTVYFIEEAISNGVLISKAISYGNACDVSFTDLLEYLQNDPETKIISAYVEGLTANDARNISKILSQITKPPLSILSFSF